MTFERQAMDVEGSKKSQLERNWDSLTINEQVQLVSNVVESRDEELQHAYRDNVESVFFSYKRGGESQRPGTTPCVTFALRPDHRKWQPGKPLTARMRGQAIPRWLLGYVGSKNDRFVCTIPTDVVESIATIPHVQTTGPESVEVFSRSVQSGRFGERGVIAARIRLGTDPERFALSCLHVFGILSQNGGNIARDAIIHSSTGKRIARLEKWGTLEPFRVARDVSLARIEDDFGVLATLALPKPMHHVICIEEIQFMRKYDIWTARGKKPAQYFEYLTSKKPLPRRKFRYDSSNNVSYLDNVVVSDTLGPPTVGGDSGSPVISQDGETFVGMHIVGIENAGKSYMIPAYELLKSEYYGLAGIEMSFV